MKTGEVVETVFKSTTSVDEEQMANSDSELDLTNTQDDVSRQVYHMAKTIQKLVANMKPTMPWPPSSEDLECEIEMVPDLLYNMMAWILSTKSEDSVERFQTSHRRSIASPSLFLRIDTFCHSWTNKNTKTCPYNDCKEPDGECETDNHSKQIWTWFIILPSRGSGDSSGRDADCKAIEWGLCTKCLLL